jgi:hypothetical protein
MLRQENIKRILINYSGRLQILQEKDALQGLDTPPHILMEIEELKIIIEQLQAELKQLEMEPQIPEDARLPSLADGIPPLQVHGYSGEWEAKTSFSHWRDIELGENETVYFDGRTHLLFSVDGKKGSGTQTGHLYVSTDTYNTTFEIANWVYGATVSENGTLHMDVVVFSRKRIVEEGTPRDARFAEDRLFGSGKFQLDLEPVPGESKRLKGIHIYKPGNKVIQKAEEDYKYLGF